MRPALVATIPTIPMLVLTLACGGCAEPAPTVHIVASSDDTIDPRPAGATKPTQGSESHESPQATAIHAVDLRTASTEGKPEKPGPADTLRVEPATAGSAEAVLTPATFAEFQALLASNPSGSVKFTLVDAWGTFCGPCKENFPHVVAMHKKYGPKGLRVVSVSFDDPEDAQAVKEAQAFLRSQNATTTNILLNEENGVAYEKFDVNAIPAVFLYGPDGKEIRRFTMDDPRKQFTYAEVEQTIDELLTPAPAVSEPGPQE